MHFSVQNVIHHYGYLGISIALFLEMLGVPFPGETILTLSGVEWIKGNFSLIPLIIAAMIGNILGSSLSYGIGRYLGRTVIIRYGKWVRINEEKLNKADQKFIKFSVILVFFGKFIAGVRVLVAYLAGINRMNFWLFSITNLLGSLLWVLAFIIFGRYLDIIWKRYPLIHHFIWPILGAIVLIFFVVIIRKKLNRP